MTEQEEKRKRPESGMSAGVTAALIALIDALPVFGTGTVLLPWAAACLLLGQAPRAVALAALYAVISAVHSFLEPKVMAAQAGLPPLAALAAMYAGFRAFGVASVWCSPSSWRCCASSSSMTRAMWGCGNSLKRENNCFLAG